MQFLGGEGGDEEVVFPLWEQIAGVEICTARSNRRHPIRERLLHAFLGSEVGHGGPVVIHAVGDDRPTVVEALLDEVELVAAARAVFDVVEFAGDGMEGEALRVAVTVAPDGGCGFGVLHERIVGGDAAVVMDAVNFAGGPGEVLGIFAVAAFADGEEQKTGAIESDTAAKVDAAGGAVIFERTFEHGLLINEGAVF